MCGTGDLSSYNVSRNCYARYFHATFGMLCEVKNYLTTSEVVTVVLMKIQVPWDMTPYSLVDSHRHYGEDFVAKKSVCRCIMYVLTICQLKETLYHWLSTV